MKLLAEAVTYLYAESLSNIEILHFCDFFVY